MLVLGVAWTVHLPPSQRSAKRLSAEWAGCAFPTAVHAIAELHDTPLRRLYGGVGVGMTVQVLPFHRSANAALWVSPALSVKPTAMQAVADVQETPSKEDDRPAMVGVG
jgi:hypothetical protein